MKAATEYKSLQQLAEREEKVKSPAGGEVIFSVAFGSGREDSNLRCKPVTWNDIITMISDKEKGEKIQIIPRKFKEFCALPKVQKDRLKNVPWWIVGVKGTHRNKKNITERTAVMLDVDHLDNEGMAGVWRRLKWNKLRYAAYTSVSHAPERNAPRWRIILPTSKPIRSAKEYAALYLYLTDLLEADGGMDTACQDWSRLMYLPSCCEDRVEVYESRTGEGEAIDMESVREVIEYTIEAKKTKPAEIPADSDYFTCVNSLDGRELCRRFASHIWQEERGGRWTYIPGEGVGGGVWFTDKAVQIFYSHHASDPWQGKGQNVWQFVLHYLFNGDAWGGKVQQFFRENYGIEYVAKNWEKKDLKDKRLKKQDNIAFLKEVSRAGSPYHYFIRTIPIPKEKEYDRDSLYNKIWETLDRIRNIFIPQRDREYNRDCWQLVQLVSAWATSGRNDSLAGATETMVKRIVGNVWQPEWMRRRYEALNRNTDPGRLEEARRRCAGLWNWWDESPGGAVDVIEYWIRQVKYGISESARRIILNFWGFEVETGKSTTAKMLSSILEGITYEEYCKAKDAALIGEDSLDREFRIGFQFERPKATQRRSVVLNDIKSGHFKRSYSHIVGFLEYNTIDLERKGVTLKDTVSLYPNYIITTNHMAADFLGKEKDRRMHAVGWDNAIKRETQEKELWDALSAWVRAVYVPEERLHDWQNDYYPRIKQEAIVKLPSIEMEEIITGKASEMWCSEMYKNWGHRGYIGNWIKGCYPAPVGTDRNIHFNNVCTALNLFAPGCLAQNKGRYFFIKADILLAAIRGETSETAEIEDITGVSEEEAPF